MKRMLKKAAAASLLAASLAGSQASPITFMDFEGVGDYTTIGDYYNGSPGPAYGVSFSPNAVTFVDSDIGGSGDFGGEPSPDTIMVFIDGQPGTMNVPAGFSGGFSFFYTAIFTGNVDVWSSTDGTGALLAHLDFPETEPGSGPNTHWVPIGVDFAGVAQSVTFNGDDELFDAVFDNFTLGSTTPVGASEEPVPEPSTIVGGLALGALVLRRIARRK
jgi:hypothetical protein